MYCALVKGIWNELCNHISGRMNQNPDALLASGAAAGVAAGAGPSELKCVEFPAILSLIFIIVILILILVLILLLLL